MKSLSYNNNNSCCGKDCDMLGDNAKEPCWGDVRVTGEWYTDDDYGWYHACEGHEDLSGDNWTMGAKYKKEMV